MSKIIAINSGSSSLKFTLYQMPEEIVLTSGQAERIGLERGVFTISVKGKKISTEVDIPNHKEAIELMLDGLVKYHIVSDISEITAAGHRIVQGGIYYSDSVKATDEVVERIEEVSDLAPLHNPAHLVCFKAFKEVLPSIEHVFVFDTAFHQTMGPESYIYPLPYEWYKEHAIRKYGAHGTSHKYVSQRTVELMDKKCEDVNIITMHLGNGASISAVKGGRCINTSMGLTPLGGIMMGTRCGDIDPSIVIYMMKKYGYSAEEMDTYLNKKSGMLGVSGISSDSRDVSNAAKEGNERALLTNAIYTNRIINTVGGYYCQLGHVDAFAFTAGIGEHSAETREDILKGLQEALGLSIDYELNKSVHGECLISKPDSRIAVYVVPTNEELAIVRDTIEVLGL